jgi:hypothetical protein
MIDLNRQSLPIIRLSYLIKKTNPTNTGISDDKPVTNAKSFDFRSYLIDDTRLKITLLGHRI